jgi:hypothetical protein
LGQRSGDRIEKKFFDFIILNERSASITSQFLSQSSLALPFPFLVEMLFRPFGFISSSSSAYTSSSSESSIFGDGLDSFTGGDSSSTSSSTSSTSFSEALGCVDVRPFKLGPTLSRDGLVSFANISTAGA